jgi:hypothetical protein
VLIAVAYKQVYKQSGIPRTSVRFAFIASLEWRLEVVH